MKKILIGLMITGGIFGEGDYRLSMNGNIALGLRYVDIDNNNISSYPKDFSYLMELSSLGKLDKNDIGGILNFTYDKLNKADIKNCYMSLDHPSCKLEGGDVIVDISDFVISNATIRGIKGHFFKKDVLFVFGRSKEKIEPSPTTSGQYRQLLGVINKGAVFRNNNLNITYLQAEDDPSSVNLPDINPIANRVLGGDITMPLGRDLSFKSSLFFSEYDPNKRDKEGREKGKAFQGKLDLNFKEISFEGIYQYIEPNFYTLGNIGLDKDYEGIKLNLSYTSDKPITTELGIERYNDNIDKKGKNTTKTEIFKIKGEIGLKSFPEISIDYKRTNEKDNEASPSKIGNEIFLGMSYGIKDINIDINYNRSSFDNKKSDEYDSSISSYALDTSGRLTKRTSLSSSISFITSKTGVGIDEIKQDSYFYLLSLSFQPTDALRLTPTYKHSKTKDKKGIILKNRTISLSADYYLSPKCQIALEYENVENKEADNNYKGDSFGVKIIGLF